MKKIRLMFPWISTSYALILCSYLYIISAPDLANHFQVTVPDTDSQSKLFALLALFILFAVEMMFFHKRQTKYNNTIEKNLRHYDEMLKTKNALQAKVHKYSDHADKLKLFISDRLLEYIEYDEKFLHFKNIASEVRHNGVVCFDKINSSLNNAIEKLPKDQTPQYEDALNSMTYLWDLLDLSTTDNMALYIANKLYEAEEQYYQGLLQPNQEELPFQPTFPAQRAIYKSIQGFANSTESILPPLEEKPSPFQYHDATFWINLEPSDNLLGNENYIVLLAENIINNALFYLANRKYTNKYSRVEVQLNKTGKNALLSIYNHGPHIDENTKQQMFQLGYSTKRIKENNGKGLGLYFVNEIAKGYESEISVDNIHNTADIYVIRLELENGETISRIIKTALDEKDKLLCKSADTHGLAKTLNVEIDNKIVGLEVAVQSQCRTYVVDSLKDKGTTVYTDPSAPARPQWVLEISHKGGGSKINFKPLDVTGVQFSVAIPTAESRLDSTYHEEQNELEDLESLDENFSEIKAFVK